MRPPMSVTESGKVQRLDTVFPMTRSWSPPFWWSHWTTASGPGRGRRVWVGW